MHCRLTAITHQSDPLPEGKNQTNWNAPSPGWSSAWASPSRSVPAGAGELERNFANPPASARPWVYWMWMDGNLSREGLTADLEAMQSAGIGGVMIMEVDVGVPKGPVKFMSPEWRQLFKHVVAEAERLGLQITLNAGPGWTGSGGPWVKPEQSMQHLVASAVEVAGPTNFDAVLPRPSPRKPYFGTGGLPPELLKAQNEFYRDVAVLAFPTPAGNERIADIDHKALYVRDPYLLHARRQTVHSRAGGFSSAARRRCHRPGNNARSQRSPGCRGQADLDGAGGQLDDSASGSHQHRREHAPRARRRLGPGIRQVRPGRARRAFRAVRRRSCCANSARRKRTDVGWTSLHIDSWEMGAQNWTAAFRDEFKRRRGYDPLRYLPAMTGRIVDSREVSERFLWDVRQTAQELVIENHAQHLKALGRRHGLGLSIEPYDMNPTADLNLGAVADVPMCEFWANCFESWYSCFEAASIAHTGGKRIVAAEAFTSDDKERWQFHPGHLKALGDWAFCAGVNRIVFHRYAHQPWLDRAPGMTMGPYGVHWERTQTWWEMVPAYHKYLARCQTLLRQGEAVADILYLTPEGAPQVFRPPKSAVRGNPPDHLEYNFDACSPETLLARATVKRGQIVFPGGTSYRLLALPEVETMTPTAAPQGEGTCPSWCDRLRLATAQVTEPLRLSAVRFAGSGTGAGIVGRVRSPAPIGTTPLPREDVTQNQERRLGKGRLIAGRKAAPTDTPTTNPLDGAKWIWFAEGDPAVPPRRWRDAISAACWFCRTNAQVESATASLTADNTFELWVNGRSAGKGDNFREVAEFEIGARLKPGTNILAVAADNGGDAPNPAGLIAAVEIRLRGGEKLHCAALTANGARPRVRPEIGRPTSALALTGPPARELGDMGMSPWGKAAPSTADQEIYTDYTLLAAVLRAADVPPDFESPAPLRYTHRREGDMDIYFVANPQAEEVTTTATFRVSGRRPEFWWPDTGRITSATAWEPKDERTQPAAQARPARLRVHRISRPGQSPAREARPELGRVCACANHHGPVGGPLPAQSRSAGENHARHFG